MCRTWVIRAFRVGCMLRIRLVRTLGLERWVIAVLGPVEVALRLGRARVVGDVVED